jgi:hypothetical protein
MWRSDRKANQIDADMRASDSVDGSGSTRAVTSSVVITPFVSKKPCTVVPSL